MWQTISTDKEIQNFMERVCYFHDSCIKEISYLSGAYVDANFSMFPINKYRILRVILQRQFKNESMIELEFQGLKCLNLFPVDECYTCEISDSTMMLKNGDIYWFDCAELLKSDFDNYSGTMICASKLRWRSIDNHMGEQEFYHADV